MTPLHFKKEVCFETGKTYSVCLRGARRYDASDEYDLSLYTPSCEVDESGHHPKCLANIISQNHYPFLWLFPKDWEDNYDETARARDGLEAAMRNSYPDFETREIVTILRFEII
jgi:hypothetical protein